jgi:hypothetical protein
MQLVVLNQKAEQERAAMRLSFAAGAIRSAVRLNLSRFRTSPRYAGRPAAADMAFCIAACAQGWCKSDITAELSRCYLSRDTNRSRQAAYIDRTVTKARRWAA